MDKAETSTSISSPSPLTFCYVVKLCTTDGEGDLEHGKRLLKLLPPNLPLSSAYIRSNKRDEPNVDFDAQS